MRFRVLTIATVAALTYLAVKYKAELPATPDPTALILNMRNQIAPFRFTLSTYPEPASYESPILLRVHVIDAAGHPADGLTLEADISMSGMDHGARSAKLRGKGNGNYEGNVKLEMAGSWDVNLTATKDTKTGRRRLILEVGSSPPSPASRREDDDDT